MLLFAQEKYVGQKYSPKNKYDFASSSNVRGLSLDDKTKDYVDRNTGGRVYSSHNSGNIHGEICIFEQSNEKNHFSKTKIYFRKKTSSQLSGQIGLQNIKVGVKANLGDLPLFF